MGTEISRKLADVLQYEFIDKEKIGKALASYGIPEPDMEKFDEKKPPLLDSMQIQRRKFLHFIQGVIYDFARKGKVIIPGRSGQVLLKDLPGVMHYAPTSDLPPAPYALSAPWLDFKEIVTLILTPILQSNIFPLFSTLWP